MYEAIDLAKYVVTKCINENCPISNLQLQKILYYIQKEFLQTKNIAAFSDNIEAWQFGPVVPNVYYHFCGFGAMPISILRQEDSLGIEAEDILMIDAVVEKKRILNPWDMVEDTHKEGGAWARIYKDGLGNRKIIPIDLIRDVG